MSEVEVLNPNEFYITTIMATGIANYSEAAMLLRYTGYNPVLLENDKKNEFLFKKLLNGQKKKLLLAMG